MRGNIDLRTVNKDKKFWLNLVIWGKFYGDVQGWQADLTTTTTITSKISVDNGSSFNDLIIKLTRRFINITITGWFPLIATFSITCRGGARYLAIAQNSSKILRIE
jgi:hypothetical protein